MKCVAVVLVGACLLASCGRREDVEGSKKERGEISESPAELQSGVRSEVDYVSLRKALSGIALGASEEVVTRVLGEPSVKHIAADGSYISYTYLRRIGVSNPGEVRSEDGGFEVIVQEGKVVAVQDIRRTIKTE